MRGIAIFVTLSLLSAPASAWCRMTTSLRAPSGTMPCVFPDPMADPPEHYLAWLRPCTAIALSVTSPSADLDEDDVRAVLGRSIATWEAVHCGETPLAVDIEILNESSTCDVTYYRDDGANVNTLMFVPEWDRTYDPAAFAVTTVWHRRSTGEILDVDIEVNEERGPYGICPAGGCSDRRTVDLENVLTHELGHYLGLAHTTDPDATMFASAVAGEVHKRDLAEDDELGICTVYPNGFFEGAACDPTPRGGLRLDCDDGCAVARPGSGAPAPAWLALVGVAILARARRQSSSRARRAIS